MKNLSAYDLGTTQLRSCNGGRTFVSQNSEEEEPLPSICGFLDNGKRYVK